MASVVGILTVSDSRSEQTDLSGPAIREALLAHGYTEFHALIVPDEMEPIQQGILRLCEMCDLVFTTGGTGFSPRDVTPEATVPLLEKRADSLCELMRLKGLEHTAFSHLSRAVAGVRGTTLIVNLPGSPKAVRQGIDAISHLLEPILTNIQSGQCPAGSDAC